MPTNIKPIAEVNAIADTDAIADVMPSQVQPWPREPDRVGAADSVDDALDDPAALANGQDDFPHAMIQAYVASKTWVGAGRIVYFFCDIHADADAFLLSMLAAGGVAKTGDADADFELTAEGRDALFIIGGDCFDKGPSNLRLLEMLHQLYLKGANLEILAGNHDIRTYLGIVFAESKAPLLDHLFARMGKKTVALLHELHRHNTDNLLPPAAASSAFSSDAIRALLFPAEQWYLGYPAAAGSWLQPAQLAKEVQRIQQKSLDFNAQIEARDMDIEAVYGALALFRALFCSPQGRYSWFFQKMKLLHREGPYLFVHGGIDDTVAQTLADHGDEGVDTVNQQFRQALLEDPFALYYGPLGNVFRTKYRQTDFAFTPRGVQTLHQAGIYALVHGHRNILRGQRMTLRAGMLNFECDASVDCNTRKAEGLAGPGGAVLKLLADGSLLGMSTDYPFVKHFQPTAS